MKLERWFTFAGLAALMVYENITSFFYANAAFEIAGPPMATRMLVTYGLILFLTCLLIRRELIGSFRHSWFVPFIYVCLLSYCVLQAQRFSINYIIGNFYRPIYGLVCMLSCEYLCAHIRKGRGQMAIDILFVGLAMLGTISVFLELLLHKSSRSYDAVNNIYFLLPLIIYCRICGVKNLRKIMPLLAVTASLISLKRGAIIIAGAIWCAMLFFEGKRRDAVKKVSLILFAIFIFLGIFRVVDQQIFNGYISERFETINEGSGRRLQFEWAIHRFATRGGDSNLIGEGYNASGEQFGMFLHNDWLLIFFDYGLIGLALYTCIHLAFLSTLRQLMARNSPFAAVWAGCWFFCFCLSLYSNFFLSYCANILPVFGCLLGKERERKPFSIRKEPAQANQIDYATEVANKTVRINVK